MQNEKKIISILFLVYKICLSKGNFLSFKINHTKHNIAGLLIVRGSGRTNQPGKTALPAPAIPKEFLLTTAAPPTSAKSKQPPRKQISGSGVNTPGAAPVAEATYDPKVRKGAQTK